MTVMSIMYIEYLYIHHVFCDTVRRLILSCISNVILDNQLVLNVRSADLKLLVAWIPPAELNCCQHSSAQLEACVL